jgi:methylmalonyl-CoA mutase cobalamin-binding subunit
MSLYSIAQINVGVAAIFKSGVNQEQFMQDLNTEKEDDKIKEPKLTI